MIKLKALIKLEIAKLLNTLGYKKAGENLWKVGIKEKNSSNNSTVILNLLYNKKPSLLSCNNSFEYLDNKIIKVAVTNFWVGFNLENGFVKYLLDLSFKNWVEVFDLETADIILTSVFPHTLSQFPEKTIAFIWENIRPDYRLYRFSLSSDFDDYFGRNVRCPFWFTEISWSSEYKKSGLTGDGAHGREPLVSLEGLVKPRIGFHKRKKFCAFVAGNPEPHRMMAVEALNNIDRVMLYGPISGKLDPRSKYQILRDFNFTLCFENSIFPGYYTEKVLQAWVAGTVPLYFSDKNVAIDFNPKSFINRGDFSKLDDFVNEVRSVYDDDRRLSDIWHEPLLLNKPTLEPVINFIRISTLYIIDSNK